MKKSAGILFLLIGILALAALACQAVVPAATPTPTAAVIPTAVPTQGTWEPGSPHPDYEHVLASNTEGEWIPEAGYVWASEDPADLSVVWKAGEEDPDHPNVVSSETEGQWNPAPGYAWADPNDPSNFDVVPVEATAEGASTKGTIENVYADYDVTVGGKLGMNIHVAFTLNGLQGVPCNVGILFFKGDNTPIMAGPDDTQHATGSGQLAVGQDFTPQDDPASYSDYTFFMPYEAIVTEPGVSSTDLKFQAGVYNYQTKGWVVQSEFYPFTLNR